MSDEFEFLDLDKKLRTTMKYLAALLVSGIFLGLFAGLLGTVWGMILATQLVPHAETIEARVNSTGIITDEQAERLSKVWGPLVLDGLTSLTDEQAESLSKVGYLRLNGLTSITDEQAESLSKVETLNISEDLKPLINKYKNQ